MGRLKNHLHLKGAESEYSMSNVKSNTTKGIEAKAATVAPAIAATPAPVIDAPATPATVTAVSKAAAYKAIADKPSEVWSAGKLANTTAGIPCSNKRAACMALYMLICSKLGVKPSANDATAKSLLAKLSTYFVGYSKAKGHALLGNEVTSNGCTGYAAFVLLAFDGSSSSRANDAKKLAMDATSNNGKVASQEPLAAIVLATYGKQEGLDAAIAAKKMKAMVASK